MSLISRPFKVRVVTAAVVLGVTGVLLSACGSSSGPTAKSIMLKALKNAAKAGWVHEAGLETSGSRTLRSNNHIGTSSGSSSVDDAGAIANVLFVGGVAYIEGNELAITHYFGIPSKHPKAIAGKWIEIRSNNEGYTQVSGSVTLKEDFSQYTLAGKVTKGKDVELDGLKAMPLYGTVGGTSKIQATLYVTTTGTILPIAISVMHSGTTSVIKWDSWGVAVTLTKPATSIPLSQALK